MLFRLLFLQVTAQLITARTQASIIDTNSVLPNIGQKADLGEENEAAVFNWESIEMSDIPDGLRLDEIPPPQGNIARSFVNEDKCGTPISTQGRIAGGQTASPGAWPWQVAVYLYVANDGDFYFHCSATLIRQDLVISAAGECLTSSDCAPLFYVSLGAQYINSPANLIAVKEIICHQNFVSSNSGHDICVATLARKVTVTSNIQPACVPTVSQVAQVDETCFMSGWGKLASSDSSVSNSLQQAQVTVLSREDCQSSHSSLSEDQFCAGNLSESFPCFADAGNPLVCMDDSKYVLKGVTSGYEEDCGKVNKKPGRFTDVTKYIDWIQESANTLKSSDRCYDAATALRCGTRITRSGTILRSPITDQDKWQYPPNTDCEWEVEAPTGMTISILSICDLNTAAAATSTTYCTEDFLEIKWNTGTRPYCGTFRSFYLNTTSTNRATIRFKSNSDDKVGRGFAVQIVFNDALGTFRSGAIVVLLSIVAYEALSV